MKRSRCQARCLDTIASCLPDVSQSRLWLPQAPVLQPPTHIPACTCDSRESEREEFCPSPGGVRVSAQAPLGPGGVGAQMPLGWGMLP